LILFINLKKNIIIYSYFILPSVIPPEHIKIMTEVIERAIAKRDKTLQADEKDGLIQCSSDGKYFFFMHEDNEPDMHKIIFSSYMNQIVKGRKELAIAISEKKMIIINF
jgi:hypothetical protein